MAIPGEKHADLSGASGASIRFRPRRFTPRELGAEVWCRLAAEGERGATRAVANLSEFGVAFSAQADARYERGELLEGLEIGVGDRCVWRGRGQVAHQTGTRRPVVGVQFISDRLDVEAIRAGRYHRVDRLGAHALAVSQAQADALPPAWRAAVGDLRVLLQALADHLDVIEADARLSVQEERRLFDEMWPGWGARYMAMNRALDGLTDTFSPALIPLARGYATWQLYPILQRCPMHRRAFEKPLGYAGDYRLMEYYYTDALDGGSLLSRFLHYLSQRYSLGQAVIARERTMRDAIREAASAPGDGPVQIVSLACGPALEVRRFLAEAPEVGRPLAIALIDQDREALEHAHREIRGAAPPNPQVRVDYLQIAMRQFLRPSGDPRGAGGAPSACDLIYSAGLFDYFDDRVAARFLQALYDRLRPGGRLLIGNLRAAADTRWVMEFVLAWRLVYREAEPMRALAAGLAPAPSKIDVRRDETGLCVLLEVTR